MIRSNSSKMVFGVAMAIYVAAAQISRAGEPLDRVKSAAEKVLQILSTPELRTKDKKTERFERLRAVVTPIFDYDEMALRTLGSHWQDRSAAEQREFALAFREFLERVYADKADLYNGEKIIYGKETVEQDLAVVETALIDDKKEQFSVAYRLRRSQGQWKIYDAVVEGIGIVSNYRSQFDRVIKTSSYDELLKRLREKK